MGGRWKAGVHGEGRAAGRRRKAEDGAARDNGACGKTTLSEASRERLGRPVLDPEKLKDYEKITGETVEAGVSPTWAEYIVAKMAHRAVKNDTGTRDARELREASERPRNEKAGAPAFLLGMKGLPRTNAVTGAAPEETEAGEGWKA